MFILQDLILKKDNTNLQTGDIRLSALYLCYNDNALERKHKRISRG